MFIDVLQFEGRKKKDPEVSRHRSMFSKLLYYRYMYTGGSGH